MAGSDGEGLPGYARMLAAYHDALAPELEAMIGTLPILEGDRVLDLACGDGTYTRWLAGRVGATGEVVGVDLSGAYLERARSASEGDPIDDRIVFVQAPLEQLPFKDGRFDLVWCAQSLFSLPEPVEALARARRLARPGGVVAVLEDDTLHQVLLPWPIEVELAVRVAELAGFAEESDRPRKFYVGRSLRQVLREAGLGEIRGQTWAADRAAPLGPAEQTFLREYFRDLRDRVAPHLKPSMLDRLDRLIDTQSEDYLPDRPDFALTVIDRLVWGRKPAG